MPKHPLTAAAAVVVVLALSSAAGRAQQAPEAPSAPDRENPAGAGVVIVPPVPGNPARGEGRQLRADEFLGATVVDARGEALGTVEDLILDAQGRIAGAVVSVGGLLGLGEKKVAVPWRELRIADRRQGADAGVVLALDRSREELETAPDFRTPVEARAEEGAEASRRRMVAQQGRVPVTPVQQALEAVTEAQQALQQQNPRGAQEALALARNALEQALEANTVTGGVPATGR